MNQPPIIIGISQEQYNALEKMRVEFAEVKQKVDLLANRPELQQWVTKKYIQDHRILGVKDFEAVTGKLNQLIADKKLRHKPADKTFNLNDLLLFTQNQVR